MEHESFFTQLANRWFGHAVAAMLGALGLRVDPEHALPDYFVTAVLVVLAAVIFVLWLKPRLSAERPGGAQQICEFLLTNPIKFGIRDLLDDNVGRHGRQFLAMTGTVAIFVLLCNLVSVIPAFSSPTGHPSVPLACALVTFFYFNSHGVRHHGVLGYLKHFSGTNPFLAILLFPVEIISTCARVLSLTIRLWANMFSSELLYGIFLAMLLIPVQSLMAKNPALGFAAGIFPAIIPLAFIGLHIFVAVIQAFVFTVLPAVYLGMAVAEEH
jgi:F-type H+-transporting ATPase subunit a